MRFEYCAYCGLTMTEDGDYETGSFSGDCELAQEKYPCVGHDFHCWCHPTEYVDAYHNNFMFDTDNEVGSGIFNDLKNHAKRGISFKARCKCGGVSTDTHWKESFFATYMDAVETCNHPDADYMCQLLGHKIKVFDQNGNEVDEPEYMRISEYKKYLKKSKKDFGPRRGLFGF